MTLHTGGCHCGRVRFTVEGPVSIDVAECNCSICAMLAYWHFIVPLSAFNLLAGAEHLTSYRFNTETAEHLFCGHCGVKSFYVPRSHPDGLSVNARCLDRSTIAGINVTPFDGANWERNVASLPPLGG